jgi:hypothetical protein
MTDEMFIKFTLESFITRREAMLADNARREARAEAPAFSGDDFFALENEILAFRNGR